MLFLCRAPQGHAEGKVQLLYVSRFGEVGDEGHHHADVDAGADGDGEGGQEEGASGGDVGQREVTFVHRLGGLERRREERLSVLLLKKEARERGEKRGWGVTHFSEGL